MLKDGKLRREHIAFAISQTVIADVTYPIPASKGSGSETNNKRPLHNDCNFARLQGRLIYFVEDLVNT